METEAERIGNFIDAIEKVHTSGQKSFDIMRQVMDAAVSINKYAKQLPKGKYQKNPFIKSYNRRPRNKQKRASAMAGMVISSAISASRIATIQATPYGKTI